MGFLTDLMRGGTEKERAESRNLMAGMLPALATEVAQAQARIEQGNPRPTDQETINILGPRIQGIANDLGLQGFSRKSLVQGFRQRPKFQAVPSGAAFGQVDPSTGEFQSQGRVAPTTPASTRVRQNKLLDVLSRHNIPQTWAEDVLDGFVDIGKDELGNNVMINKLTGRQQPVNARQAKAVQAVTRDQPASTKQIPPIEEAARQGTGPMAGIQSGITKASGLLPYLRTVPFAKTREARTELDFFAKSAERALVNNPKFPVAETQRVKGLIPTSDRFFENPNAAAQDLTKLREFLSRENDLEEDSLQQPMSPKFRQAAQERIRVRRMIIEMMGKPEGFDVPLTPEAVDNMTDEEVAEEWRRRRGGQ